LLFLLYLGGHVASSFNILHLAFLGEKSSNCHSTSVVIIPHDNWLTQF